MKGYFRKGIYLNDKRHHELVAKSLPMTIKTFATSIWDETLYKAWSSIVYSLIPNVGELEGSLRKFCELSDADEVILFERTTLLVISHVTRIEHEDKDRFEKVSNIIKQFKMSCSKSQAQFLSIEIRKNCFSAFIQGLTGNTVVMVVLSDPLIRNFIF